MVSESSPPRRPILTLDDLAQARPRPEKLHALSAAELATAFSQALDLAEGKPAGHAQRVCYIAATLAEALDLSPEQRTGVYFGALLHDIGTAVTAADVWRRGGIGEDALFAPSPLKTPEEVAADYSFADMGRLVEAMHRHCAQGAELALSLELPEEVAAAIRSHHERADGAGFPRGAAAADTPVEARLISVADVAESLIGGEHSSLSARRNLPQELTPFGAETLLSGPWLDPTIIGCLLEKARADTFWLGLYSSDMADTLASMRPPGDTRRSTRRALRFAEVFADLSDAKGHHTAGHSRRTAEGATKLAEALSLDAGHVEMVRVAALLHDIGLLGVPARVMSKPDILSVSEMQVMRQHPAHAEAILHGLPGFEEIATWIARHHERPDGRGYPEMLSSEEIPLESRILAVADVYSALTGERPHRGALSQKDAKSILRGAAGTQLDGELVQLYCTLV